MIFQAIVTTYHGPTNVKGSRIKAKAAAKTKWFHWDHSLNVEQNHTMAAHALAKELDWSGVWFGGGLPDTSGFCFVNCGHTCKDEAFHVLKVEG